MGVSYARLQSIEAIVQAVRDDHDWRIGVLLDRFVPHAGLPALLALSEAPEDGLSNRPPPDERQHPENVLGLPQ
ncbi:hypothetical protein [Streptomyces sp. Ac-502]|uniref:hypothetical protein n=1 Tax=Streptomyces sp. Ac-502 TaxID=3342801 RepID=UPI003862704A